jgi:DNA-binding winged helix-turn-helix (wHTH) protein/tetratricopeptide (TPR) repeat protein
LDGTKKTFEHLEDSPEAGFAFGGFRLESDGTLVRGGSVVHLPPRELSALRLLLRHAGQIVTPLQLRRELWGDVHVTADSVPRCLSSLRARLEPEKCIQTVYKRGYRFTAEVRQPGSVLDRTLPRLAIVPFATGFSVPEYLGPVIAEEAMARLTAAPHPVACILARDSVFTLAGRGLTALEIGEKLKADQVLTGTLRALPAHFRLRAEMIRVEDGAQIWVEDLLVDRNRIAGLEAELVNRLVFRLGTGGLSISAYAEPFVERRKRPERRQAFAIYQRAHHEWQTLQRHRMQDSLQGLSRAADLDPSLIAAKADLVHLCVTQAIYGFMSPAVAADLARRTGIPRFEAVLPALGWIDFHVDHNLPAALQAFSSSAHLPHDPWITRLRVMFALSRHRFDEAIGLLRAAIQLDPYSPWLHARLAWALHLDGQAAASVEKVEHCLELFPAHEGTGLYGTMILAFNGETARAAGLAQALSQRLPHFDIATSVNAYALACEGRADEARAILERLQWLSRERFVIGSFTPAVWVALGDLDAALAELRSAEEARCPWFFQMLADPRLSALHGHPEFERMRATLTRMEEEAAKDQEAEP